MTLERLDGICPAVFTIWTDETCRELDEDAYKDHLRFLTRYPLGALVVGGHASEIPAQSDEEKVRIIRIAKDIAGDKMPIVAGICSDSTREAIKQGKEARDAGADAVMITPPSIPGWTTADPVYMIRHFGAFEEHARLPIVLIGAPAPEFGTVYHLSPNAIADIVRAVPSIIAVKITSSWNLGAFVRARRAIKEVRDISCLQAGAQNTFGTFVYGADGNLSGATNFRPDDDVQILADVKAGRLDEARRLADSWNEVTDVMYGMQVGLPVVPFHYRYKVVAWLMGMLPRPHMRLPQLPPPLHEIELLREALLRAEKRVVREAQEIAVASPLA